MARSCSFSGAECLQCLRGPSPETLQVVTLRTQTVHLVHCITASTRSPRYRCPARRCSVSPDALHDHCDRLPQSALRGVFRNTEHVIGGLPVNDARTKRYREIVAPRVIVSFPIEENSACRVAVSATAVTATGVVARVLRLSVTDPTGTVARLPRRWRGRQDAVPPSPRSLRLSGWRGRLTVPATAPIVGTTLDEYQTLGRRFGQAASRAL